MMRRLISLGLGVLLIGAGPLAAEPNVTSYAGMTSQLQADAARCPLVRVASIGKSVRGKKDLWLVRVAAEEVDTTQTVRLLVLCRQHGDEPASTEAVLNMIHRLAAGSDPLLRRSLAHVSLYFLPMINPEGADLNTRTNAGGADLNRDWGVFHQPETLAVANAVKKIHPNLLLDAHNWDDSDEYDADCLEIPREAVTPLGKAGHAVQQEAVRQLAASGYVLHPTAWGPDTDPHLAHRWFAGENILSLLVETHSGSTSDRGDFQRRQGLYVALIHGLAAHYSTLYAAEKPRLDTLEGLENTRTSDSAFFRRPPAPASTRTAAHAASSYAWLWALGVFGLALWGGKRPGSEDKILAGGVRLPGRYSAARKRDGTDTRARSGHRRAVSIPPR